MSLTWGQAKAKVLYRFQGGAVDGQYPSGQLLVGSHGNLYGATPYGGGLGSCGYNGQLAYCGTVFQLTPNANGSWKENVIYRFTGEADGGVPYAAPIADKYGNLYGTAGAGGDVSGCEEGEGCGTVFELTPGSSEWKESVLFTFTKGPDIWPVGGLVLDPIGNLYARPATPFSS